MRYSLKKHKRKIVRTTPFIFFIFFGLNVLVVPEFFPRESITLAPIDTARTVEVGDIFFVDVEAFSDTPINAAEAAISFPPGLLEVENISLSGSIFDLWPRKPMFSNASGTIRWSGGTVRAGGFAQKGKIMNIGFVAKKPGNADIHFESALFAAADGKGTILSPQTNGVLYTIRPEEAPSSDLNSDGAVTFADINLWIAAYFKGYDPKYDLNGDGKLTLSDLAVFLSR